MNSAERTPSSDRKFWTHGTLKVAAVCVLLLLAVALVYGQTLHHEFVFDDYPYVYENPIVQKGLTLQGFRWALTYGEIGHWHPLTWLTHMLDIQLYGLRPGGHHLTNVLLHAASAILLFLLLWRVTGFPWRSAFVAAVFAVHPLRAESVAWVAERKDVLSGLFFMLTILAYVRYVKRPDAKISYGTVIVLFALGLLSKNMLMTLPFALLLLDYWPLNRVSAFTPKTLLRLVAEKWPLFALMAVSCMISFLVPEEVPVGDRLPLAIRLENAAVSYVVYLWQMVDPSRLAAIYPNPTGHLPFWQVVGTLGFLVAISGTAVAFWRKYPYLIVGWLWYLGMLIPVIGIVQISSYAAHADRYTYLSQIGVYLILTWAIADLSARWRYRGLVFSGLSAVILFTFIYHARTQVSYWKNNESLWTHAIVSTAGNYVAHNNLGNTLEERGQREAAIAQYLKALEIKPDYCIAHYNLGRSLAGCGQIDAAIAHYQKALEINPDNADTLNNLGNAFEKKGRIDSAIAHYQKALEIKPDDAKGYNNLGNTLFRLGHADEAIAHYQRALEIAPDSALTNYNLGIVLAGQGKIDEAIVHYRRALEINPDNADIYNDLGIALARIGRIDSAIAYFQKALKINPDYMITHNNLGNALARQGQIDAAIVHYRKALEINPDYIEARNNLDRVLRQHR